jgi:putative toxin-antitoxin system antitoxin component (TIGR02293 family)
MRRKSQMEARRPNEVPSAKRLSQIRSEAERVWGDRDSAAEWLSQPHCELEGKSPLSLLDTEEGFRTVEALLGALNYGFPV